MASSSSLAQWGSAGGRRDEVVETIEIDPVLANGLGFAEGDIVRLFAFLKLYPYEMDPGRSRITLFPATCNECVNRTADK